jgi:hypothetical protein
MATTQTNKGQILNWPLQVACVELSAILAGEPVDVTHSGPSGASVKWMTYEITEMPTSHDVLFVVHDKENDSTTNNTARVTVETQPGGDLTGAIVRCYFWFVDAASGGIG